MGQVSINYTKIKLKEISFHVVGLQRKELSFEFVYKYFVYVEFQNHFLILLRVFILSSAAALCCAVYECSRSEAVSNSLFVTLT